MATAELDIEMPVAFQDLFKPSRYKAFYSGRGCAKSHSIAMALLLRGVQKPLRVLCAREIQKSIKDSVKLLLDDKIGLFGIGNFYESLKNEIKGSNGTTFNFAGLGTMTADQIKSMEGIDIVWVEEAQNISQRSLEILIPTIRKPGSELWFSWNPRHPTDPVDQLFRGEVVPENAIIRRVRVEDNPYFPGELLEEMEFDRKQKPDRFAHIWMGEYEPTAVGAIWSRQNLHQNRRAEAPELERIVVAVDPAISSGDKSDEHGILVQGIGSDGRGYVLDDQSIKGTPGQWANRAISTFDRYEADALVIEINQGGDMVRHTLESIRPSIPIIEVRATRGKHVRAEPISALYEQNRISHVGSFPDLEAQMCQMTAGGYEGEGSPDRVDAMVWGFTELMPQLVASKQVEEPMYDHYVGEGSWLG